MLTLIFYNYIVVKIRKGDRMTESSTINISINRLDMIKQITDITNKYSSKVKAMKNKQEVNAKSILGLVSLTPSNKVYFVADGPDASEVIHELKGLEN